MKGTLILSGLLATTVSAHMQLSKPYPIRSPLNTAASGEKDYSYTNPLSTSGSDYPCKGYANDKFEAVATWQPGSSQEMTLEGSAVIESIEGDCPIAKKYEFDIPSDAPSGDALFAWTWFNKVGNREMYMNCAMVTIGGSGNRNATIDSQDRETKKTPTEKGTQKASTSFSSLPDIFVANAGQAGQCVTIEGEAVHFPNPGPKLIGSAEGPGYKCSTNAPFLASGSDSQSSKPNSTTTTKAEGNPSTTGTTTTKAQKKPPTTVTTTTTVIKPKQKPATTVTTTTKAEKKPATTDTTTTKATSKIAQPFGTASASADTRVLSTEASSNNQFANYVTTWSCHSGDLICAPDGLSFALCTNGKPIFMGSVAAGTLCRSGVITASH
ncbi:unnamed protein product [Penicillium glandicola]